jgi:hypothetical protein
MTKLTRRVRQRLEHEQTMIVTQIRILAEGAPGDEADHRHL